LHSYRLSDYFLLSSRHFFLLLVISTSQASSSLVTFLIPNFTMGSLSGAKSFPPGIHVPSLTWFGNDASQEIDWDVQNQHMEILVKSGLHGSKYSRSAATKSIVANSNFATVVLAGTNREAVALTSEEKARLVRTTREIAAKAGRPDLAVTMGCGGQCTRDVIAETKLAKEAGADFALVLVPSYFHFAMNEDAILSFFEEVGSLSSKLRFLHFVTDK
jgi:hypothetical protein